MRKHAERVEEVSVEIYDRRAALPGEMKVAAAVSNTRAQVRDPL
jgi:hypothetical protein